ncbi:MAG: hypothetical protein ACI4JR_02070 [Acutalibacteraceae bacterium]
MKPAKRLTALILCAALIFSTGLSVGFADTVKAQTQPAGADVSEASSVETALSLLTQTDSTGAQQKQKKADALTECGGTCEHCPTIIVPGIGQSDTYMYDGDEIAIDENGDEITGWPLYVNANQAVKSLLVPLVKMLVTQKDNGFSEKFGQTLREVLYVNQMDSNGENVYDVRVEKYPYSVAKCNEEEKNHIYGCVPIQDYTAQVGEDHLYYFAYNSFGNNRAITDELYEFIQQVKRETGHDKINIVHISLGGTLANSLYEYYPEVYSDLNRVIYIVPALDGTNLVGDLYLGKFSTSDEMLYDKLFPSLVDGYLGYLINILIRIIPKQVLLNTIDETLEALTDVLLINCTTMWSLVPDEYYDAAVERLLQGEEHAEIRRQVEEYHRAQVNSDKNILAMKAAGVEVFNVVDYDYPMYALVPSYDQCNADGIIHFESTSMGAFAAKCGETLPEGYVQQNINCDNPNHNHISPDNVVDASVGLLPDHTFYFDGQDHEGTGRNDVIMKLATELLINEDFTDVYSMPERFPQFNVGRETKNLRKNLIPKAEAVDRSTLSPEDAAELDAALNDCYVMLDNTVVDYQQYVDAQKRLEDILVKIGVIEGESKVEKAAGKIAEALLKLASDALYEYFGPRGFSDKYGA